MYTHIYTHKQNQNRQKKKKKKAEVIDPVSKGKQKWY